MSDAHSRIAEIVSSHDVVLFMKGTPLFPQCGFSSRAIAILDHLNVRYDSIDVLQDMDIRQGIKGYSDWPTIPQLYVKGEFVGGSDIMMEMFEAGELEQLMTRRAGCRRRADTPAAASFPAIFRRGSRGGGAAETVRPRLCSRLALGAQQLLHASCQTCRISPEFRRFCSLAQSLQAASECQDLPTRLAARLPDTAMDLSAMSAASTRPAKGYPRRDGGRCSARAADRGPPELLMVQRAREMRFAGGAAVFPGGRVDPADRALAARLTPDARPRCRRRAGRRRSARRSRKPAWPSRSTSLCRPREAAEARALLLEARARSRRCSTGSAGRWNSTRLAPFAHWCPKRDGVVRHPLLPDRPWHRPGRYRGRCDREHAAVLGQRADCAGDGRCRRDQRDLPHPPQP